MKREAKRMSFKVDKRLLRRGIGEQWQKLSWKDWKGDKVALKSVKKYLKEDIKIGMYLYGEYGSGKTMLGMEILKEMFRRGKSILAVRSSELFDFDAWQLRDKAKRVNTLLIDDLGKEYRKQGSDWVLVLMDELFRARLNRLKPTIVTTNISPQDIKTVYAESLADLFREMFIVIPVEGESYRKKISKNRKKKEV